MTKNFMIKELQAEDLEKYNDFFETLSHLSKVIPMSVAESKEVLKKINAQDGHIFVYILDNTIVSCVTLLIEQKFLRGGAKAGHIEDVVTHEGYERKGYASLLIQHSLEYAQKRNCYKVVLYCKEEFNRLYSKNKFKVAGIHMEFRG